MKRIIAFTLTILVIQYHAAGQNMKAVYWFNNDFANHATESYSGKSYNRDLITSSAGYGLQSFNIYFISNSTGKHSGTKSNLFYRISGGGTTNYQYWFDNNFNAAIPGTLSGGQLITDIATAGLNFGLHSFNIRFRDGGNTWSSITSSFFYFGGNTGGADTYQYWFDNNFSTASNGTVFNNQFITNIVTTGLGLGLHLFNIRFAKTGGLWSSVNTSFVYKTNEQGGQDNYQYWFDNAYYNAISTKLVNNTLVADIGTGILANGVHSFYFRTQKSGGMWSGITASLFYKNALASGASKAEYWYDQNYSDKRTFTITDPANIVANLDAAGVTKGRHLFSIRFLLNGALWSGATSDSITVKKEISNCLLTNPPIGEALTATNYLCSNDIIIHTQDGTYNKANAIRRKDLAKIAFRSLYGTDENPVATDSFPNPFADLQAITSSNEYYFSAAKALSYLEFNDGITPFNRDRINFYPEDSIARGYVLKVYLEAWNIKPDSTLPNPYTDIPAGSEVKGYILKARQLGLLPQTSGLFHPYDPMKREDAFIILYRLLAVVGLQKPLINYDSYYKPYNQGYAGIGNVPAIDRGNFNSYSENCFSIKGVPSLNLSINYNAAATEMPDEFFVQKSKVNNQLLIHQLPLGAGWNHSYNAYIILDQGTDDINTVDDRLFVFWPGGSVHIYNPQAGKYETVGVYDEFKITKYQTGTVLPTIITIRTKNFVTYTFQRLSGISSATLLQLVSVTDRNNNTVTLSYENGNSGGSNVIRRLKTVSTGANRSFTFAYNTANQITAVTSTAGSLVRTINFTYDGADLKTYKNPNGNTTTYTYSKNFGAEHLLTRIQLPKGNIIDNTYSTQRKLTNSKYSGGNNTAVTLNTVYNVSDPYTQSQVTTSGSGNTYTQTTQSNFYGQPANMQGPALNSEIKYEDARNPLLPTFAKDNLTGITSTMQYDEKGNMIFISKNGGATGLTETSAYNLFNDMLSHIDANGNTSTYTYNNTGNLIKANNPIGSTSIAPNSNGTIASITNPEGIATTFTYDANGNPLTTNMPLNITSKLANDGAGRVIAVTNPNGKITGNTYDNNDNRVLEMLDTSGLRHSTQFLYDLNDNLTTITNAKNKNTTLTYNDKDELTKEQFGAYSKQYSYNEDGSLSAFTNPNGTVFTIQYNLDGQIINDGYSTYTYNTDKTLHSIARSNKAITYTYDDLKRIKTTEYNDFTANVVGYGYDNNGNVKSITYPGGFTVLYDYDANNRLTVVKNAAGIPYAIYTYLQDGRLQQQVNKNGTLTKYFYDAAGRMDSMVNLNNTNSVIASYGFDMDNNGNHSLENTIQPQAQITPNTNGSSAYSYDDINRLLTKNSQSFFYDNNGNNTSLKNGSSIIRGYTYDAKNNLTGCALESGNKIFEYDGLQQRRRDGNTRFVLDMNQNVLMETDLSGKAKYYYIQGLGLVARVKAAGSDEYYYHYDYRGSTVAITNAANAVTHKYAYGAFGEMQKAREEDFNAYRYVGKYGVQYEDSTLYFMRARYYNPVVGRFLSEDPAIWNTMLFGYSKNNPLSQIDPIGLDSWNPTAFDRLGVTSYGPDGFFNQIIGGIKKGISRWWQNLWSNDNNNSMGGYGYGNNSPLNNTDHTGLASSRTSYTPDVPFTSKGIGADGIKLVGTGSENQFCQRAVWYNPLTWIRIFFNGSKGCK